MKKNNPKRKPHKKKEKLNLNQKITLRLIMMEIYYLQILKRLKNFPILMLEVNEISEKN